MNTRVAPWVLFAVLTFIVRPAAADLPPPPNYVEKCTVENQQQPEEACKVCGTYLGARDRCEKEFGTKGYSFRCRTYGASVWREVWCKPSEQKASGEE